MCVSKRSWTVLLFCPPCEEEEGEPKGAIERKFEESAERIGTFVTDERINNGEGGRSTSSGKVSMICYGF